jgi:hypothetical protein
MPRKPSPTTALVQELHAARVAANQARRAEEAPIRAARRKLVERLASATRAVDRVNEKLSRIIYHAAFRKAHAFATWAFQVGIGSIDLPQGAAVAL